MGGRGSTAKAGRPNRAGTRPEGRWPGLWSGLGLETRFNLASPLILSLVVLGWWVGRAVEVGVVHRTAATSLFVENFIVTEPQKLGERVQLSPAHVARLGWLLDETPLGREIVAIIIWEPDGRIVYGAGETL